MRLRDHGPDYPARGSRAGEVCREVGWKDGTGEE